MIRSKTTKSFIEKSNNIRLIISSYKKLLGRDLIKDGDNLDQANFVCAAHLFYPDEPKFIYGNQKALELWELDTDSFIGMPSKFTAEAEQREARQKLLDEVREKGYIKNYAGFRVSSTGKKFVIRDAVVWNLLDQAGKAIGQAVKFSDYEYL